MWHFFIVSSKEMSTYCDETLKDVIFVIYFLETRELKWAYVTKYQCCISLGDNTIISNIAIPFFIRLRYRELFKLSRYRQIVMNKNISWWKKYIAIKKTTIAIVSQVINSMETKLGQSFQLSEVRTTSVGCRITKEPHEFANVHGVRVNGAIAHVSSQLSAGNFIVTLRGVRTCGYQP